MNSKFNQKEKVIGFTYVFMLFAGITTVCCLLLFYYNSDFLIFSQKNIAVTKMNKIKEYQTIQENSIVVVDSLFNKIYRYQPMVNAIYEENDIQFMINELKNNFEQRSWDPRYKSFYHISMFYSMWFTDKKELWSKRESLARLKQDLEDCEIGVQNKKNELRLSLNR